MIRLALFALVASATIAHAQQQPTLAEMRGALAASVAQLDAVRNLHIQAEAKAAGLAEENAKLKAQIEDLQKKPPEK